jgi:hypothetical protein
MIKKISRIAFLICISCGIVCAQSTIKGKVVDEKGENLIGVIVMLKSSSSVATSTDIDGNYILKLASQTVQVVSVSYIGYQTIIDTLFLKKAEERTKNYILTPLSFEIQDVQVLGRAKKSDDKYMESIKAKSVSTIDFISSATMKRTGDANISAAVGRVAGVSSNGAFITVRGIGDRYIKTTINGMRIPTLDPFTNNIKLDLFPSSLVDNIILTKTPSADLSGDWAGAYISIETKDYPDKLMVNVETSWGYNNQTSFKDVLTSQDRSSTDWLGYDGGKHSREYDNQSFVKVNTSPSPYDQYIALGLGDYFKSLGVNNTNWVQNADLYNKLGLIELGLLDKANINNNDAVIKAQAAFQKQDYNKAYDIINKSAVNSNMTLPKDWTPKFFKAPLNNSQSLSIGNQTLLFGKTFGYLVGFKYSSSVLYDPKSTGFTTDQASTVLSGSAINQQVSRETNGWSGLIDLAYEFNHNNKLVLMFMPNFIGVNNVRGVSKIDTIGSGLDILNSTRIFYEERKQLVYQIKSENLIPGPNIKITTNVSYTDGSSLAPDLINSYYNPDNLSDQTMAGGSRIYRLLSEKLFDSKTQIEIPIFKNSELSKKLIFGGNYQRTDRDNQQYQYVIKQPGTPFYKYSFSIDSARNADGTYEHILDKWYDKDPSVENHTMGYSIIQGGFAMFDFMMTNTLRISGGMRIEHATMLADVYYYDSLKLAANDTRRGAVGMASVIPGLLDKTDYLPSIALIYKIVKTTTTPLNLKLNFAQTIARPSLRELTGTSNTDYELNQNVTGVPTLQEAHIDNYDARLEYSQSGDNVSLNLFAKEFTHNIYMEQKPNVGYLWDNDSNKVFLEGIEIEGKKSISKHFECRANVTFTKSKLKAGSIPLYGQAPYIVNGMITYTSDSLKLNISLMYNVQGARLYAHGMGLPDTYECPRNLLDFKVAKTFGKHFTASITIKDILNSPVVFRFRDQTNGNWQNDFNTYHWGTTYNFALAYKL